MFDLIVKGGDVVDGTGAPRRRADVGVRGSRIEAIGDLSQAQAAKVIDATGRVVTPGFIDVHTHIDAQAFWDTTLSPSPLHGVTTAIAGNCGFSIAPLGTNPDDGVYLMKMLSRVEGMPLESLQVGVPWNWDTTEEYLAALDNTLAINAGFKVGHSALRRVVMGPAATEREATPDEIERMCGLLRDGLRAGALGFSSSWSTTHNDTERHMVPSRYSSREELVALCAVLADFEGTSLEFIPKVGPFERDTLDLMADMSVAAKAPLNWNVLPAHASNKAEREQKLAGGDVAAARGGKVVGLTAPMTLNFRLSFISGFILDAIPGWDDVMLMSKAEKLALLSDPAERRRLGELAAADHPMRHFANWPRMIIHDTFDPANEGCLGRTIGEIAEERGLSPWDTLCEIAVADDLRTSFGHPKAENEPIELWEARVETWRDPRAVVGASDAGAHLDMFLSANYSTVMLGEAVVKRKMMPIEEAIRLLTAVPADLYGIVDRGRLVEGAYADLVVLDEHSVGSNDMVYKHDLPAGAPRLYADAHGIDSVVCNGVEIVRGTEFTDARPGTILRSGTDTTGKL
ncbi:MAG: amidohydrolase family protein [Actinomycetota bacterium]|nr:amidohydrolase family protein [Actinomycetota bacterium]